MVKLTGSPSEIKTILSTLTDTPRRIKLAAGGGSEARLSQAPAGGQWSAVEILAHLRACQEVWTYSIYAMLALDHPTLASIHPRQWAQVRGYERLAFWQSLSAFSFNREELLENLRELPPEGWERGARIGDRDHSVFSQARRMALHEVGHCEQVESLLLTSG